jgi:hypothetical protein
VVNHKAIDPYETLNAFRAVTDCTDTPPGPLATRLVEAYVHGEDIRRPLGIHSDYPSKYGADGSGVRGAYRRWVRRR